MADPARREPPDGGWGWMVVLAGFLQSALVFGVIRSFGVFFMEFVGYFGELAGRVSWVTSIGIAVLQLGGPVSSALSSQYGARPVVMAGGFLSGLGMILASFATSLTHLYLSIGVVSGLGWALVFTPSVASVAQYFAKRRTFATGLAVSGAGLASFAFSPLFQLLVDTYAWRGALLVVAGISFNLVAAGALLRPLEPEGKATSGGLPAFSSLCRPRLACHRPFLLFAVAFVLVDAGYYVPYVHLVPHARELGFDEYRAAFLLSSAAVADLCGRVAGGWLADRFAVRLVHSLTLWTALTGLSMLLLPLGQSYSLLMGLCICYGFCAGALVPLQFSGMAEIVGTGRITEGIGLMQMMESAGSLVGAPLSGWLRDMTGDYTASFTVAGAFLLAGSLLLFALPNYFSCSMDSTIEEKTMGDP
ncbi:monocarboxylate transporter 13-like [Mauremys mutica]|uniref:monocarboxylate transporter 13-like n=1 Tax=Mauremys mutica TaxID=74926 RepID=UPI001D14D361|nr:monocarboxylate transporter 13-like [Mauremys mutica]XP_044857415.1 monocarboxylate transporter 13-like [Mauremys mutica]XP_044857416.1 monocarboxylate transporter 13-like [Mauremys mutica]